VSHPALPSTVCISPSSNNAASRELVNLAASYSSGLGSPAPDQRRLKSFEVVSGFSWRAHEWARAFPHSLCL
jgi:hypothetical protein